MRTKSKFYNDVYKEPWKTPMGHPNEFIRLGRVLTTTTDVHFFFFIDDENRYKKKIAYVLTIDRWDPLRITEEKYNCSIGKYLKSKLPYKFCATWKLWGTNFIKEVDQGHALSDYKKKQDKNICQYLIISEDLWIEFISDVPPKWEIYKNTTLKEIMKPYLNKWNWD